MISTTNRSNWSETFTLFNPLSFENETFTFFSYCFLVQDVYWQHLNRRTIHKIRKSAWKSGSRKRKQTHHVWRLHHLHGKKTNFAHRKVRFSKVQNWSHWPCHPSSFPNWMNSSSYKIWSLHFLKSRGATHDVALFVM